MFRCLPTDCDATVHGVFVSSENRTQSCGNLKMGLGPMRDLPMGLGPTKDLRVGLGLVGDLTKGLGPTEDQMKGLGPVGDLTMIPNGTQPYGRSKEGTRP
ncbi:hypothetical protein CDL15_Pgr011145 [Punica granatum]|uniref:Uncharacterized protein n=1 Tax=Punica granatum TaxID=22663 RepID=A0A218WYI7_PUNGR|nr:hypothetical protein CDL15_Pgr011145 [Punica granatum]